ncbi:hypothetical protein RAAC3_TM7C00001G0902 [Candidatus Saccharibacteria bacterium RAAC3_TM7_1]|nr:hypothetical protein RAAC3_TM7C00001G0902 [Candidatus Saccharibacteria bacterium RAAC3_TM7_1]HCZ28192.1 hypothetical protein [Candidatus Saccharibacteria bacterium]
MTNWKQEQSALRNKLIRELKITRPASFDEKVNRLARKKSISAAAALHIIAKQMGKSDQRGFQKLTPSEQESVRGFHSKTTNQTMINSPGAFQVAQVSSSQARANTRSNHKLSTKITADPQKSWHETWWGAILIAVVAGAILLGIQLWVV